ncbi:hypothetical protein SELMODRAFT_445130 [Selaginella moellendorffii]|uniref:HMA domain-containing protein n=1 Tax=Selaginella moellendorffii TaxID=88036 RepID=D8SG01_SELML|nr:uncharacterized protein LOC9635952 [Selaginella moellendorffii]EFJ16496.1 hypothetical protein SELMODRAFT_445130 [Selaginella moellendorffii]|eukprot:XP_002982251.1 uncharacterized protein LOC9635952 [Selaginella moellendorffii]
MSRKAVLKVDLCGKCKDNLLKKLSEVPGVAKAEATGDHQFTLTGDFKIEDINAAIASKKRCVSIESVQEIPKPDPPKPDPPKPPPEVVCPNTIVIHTKNLVFCFHGRNIGCPWDRCSDRCCSC